MEPKGDEAEQTTDGDILDCFDLVMVTIKRRVPALLIELHSLVYRLHQAHVQQALLSQPSSWNIVKTAARKS